MRNESINLGEAIVNILIILKYLQLCG
jgi:hypothetical protein